jgi:AcrR family transcriptional regulator
MQSDTKTRILQRSARLFFEEGFATGIDRVTSECGTAKMTIYQHFKNKRGLICAILKDIQDRLHEQIRQSMVLLEFSSSAQLEAVSFTLCRGMNDPELRLGLVVRALIEFPDPQHSVHVAARQMDVTILNWVEHLCEKALMKDPRQVARQILEIAKGGFLIAPTVGVKRSESSALALLRPILTEAEGPTDGPE